MLQFYYGRECEHCHVMMPLVEKLESEHSVNIERLETWHDEANHDQFEKASADRCPGVPFFLNTENGDFLCGEVSYTELVNWAGKN